MPFINGGGGGSGGGVTPPVTITGTNPATVPLTIKAAASQSARTLNIIDSTGNDIIYVTASQTSLFAGSGGQGGTDFSEIDVGGGVTLRDVNGTTRLTASDVGVRFPTGAKVNENGYLILSTHSAPADAALNAGDCALWFDQTNGAAKLMVKAKTANGTVAAASIALA